MGSYSESGTLVLLFFTVWMSALIRNVLIITESGSWQKAIIEGTANYVVPDGGTGLDVGCGSGALTIASLQREIRRQSWWRW